MRAQAQTLELLLAGNDMVGRARTGCGKTLAFVLPIVEKLAESMGPNGRRTFGRQPSVIVLLPTRELAKQVGRLSSSRYACTYAQGNTVQHFCVCPQGSPVSSVSVSVCGSTAAIDTSLYRRLIVRSLFVPQ